MPPQTLPLLTQACPCGSARNFGDCCAPLLNGQTLASSPEALMRSRYSAHVCANIDYLMATWAPEVRQQIDPDTVRQWATSATWLGLTVIRHTTSGDSGNVEFIARYRDADGELQAHHEHSRFRRDQGIWLFVDGTTPQAPGRNSPCPCGSGKKYKRCCA